MKKIGMILAVLASVMAGCEEAQECSSLDAAHCSSDGKGIMICDGRRWVNEPCDAGLSCANIASGVFRVPAGEDALL